MELEGGRKSDMWLVEDTYPTSCKAGSIDLQATIASKQINLSCCCQSTDYCHVCLSPFRPVAVRQFGDNIYHISDDDHNSVTPFCTYAGHNSLVENH
eukprot:sb/3479019/